MAFLQSLPAPRSLEGNDSNVAAKWNKWKEMSAHYSVASKVNKGEDTQAATLLTAIGPEARRFFKTWNLSPTERKDIKGVTTIRERTFLSGVFTCLLLCQRLVESKRIRPFLGKSACEGVGAVQNIASDSIRWLDTNGSQMFSVDDVMSSCRPLTKN